MRIGQWQWPKCECCDNSNLKFSRFSSFASPTLSPFSKHIYQLIEGSPYQSWWYCHQENKSCYILSLYRESWSSSKSVPGKLGPWRFPTDKSGRKLAVENFGAKNIFLRISAKNSTFQSGLHLKFMIYIYNVVIAKEEKIYLQQQFVCYPLILDNILNIAVHKY